MIQDLVKPNDPILLQIAEEIPDSEITSQSTKKFIEKILEASYGRRKDKSKPNVVGLAAPQIGISKRIIAVDVGADGKGGLSDLRIYINPKITWKSQDEVEWYEGCWSTDRVCGIVSRPNEITVKALTPDGKKVEETYKGYVARIFQHEIDHLDGKEFVTHITDDNKLHWVEENEFPQYRNNEGWRHWQKKCPREKWEKIKGIIKTHRNKTYKESAVILVFNNDGELALQLRAANDNSFPLHWDFSSAGGIETNEKPKKAAIRELQEELGIEESLTFVKKEVFEGQYSQGKFGQDELYIYKAIYEGSFIIDPNEVEKVQFFSFDKIEEMLTSIPFSWISPVIC